MDILQQVFTDTFIMILTILLHTIILNTGSIDAQMDHTDNTESMKEQLRALYMNMDVPEIGPGDTTGTLNVSMTISEILSISEMSMYIAMTLELRWKHGFLEMLKDSMEAMPLNKNNLWTPKFVFVNIKEVQEDQSSLYLHLSQTKSYPKSVVYKLWYRAKLVCDGPRWQYPFGDSLCQMMFQQATPENSRSLHMSLHQQHQLNCSHQKSLSSQRSFVFRMSKPFTDEGNKVQFLVRICVKTNTLDVVSSIRKHGVVLLMVTFSLSTLFFQNHKARLPVNLVLLLITVLESQWVQTTSEFSAITIWFAMSLLIVSVCAVLSISGSDHQSANNSLMSMEEHNKPRSHYSGTMSYHPKELLPGNRVSKCTTISESSDNFVTLDRRRPSTSSSRTFSSHLRMMIKGTLPVSWVVFISVYWVSMLLTAKSCDRLIPECFNNS